MATQKLEVDFSRVMCLPLVCTLDTRNLPKRQYTYSSEFQFRGGGWKLRYCKGTCYYLDLQMCSGVFPDPFHSSVHVESSEDGRMASVLTQEERLTTEFEREGDWHLIWEKDEDEVLRSVPEFRLHGVLRLIVVLRVGEDDSSESKLCKSVMTNKDPCLESLSEDLSKLLNHKDHANHDVEFQCGGHSIKAHQAVVSARSQVIESMLASDMVEGRTKVVRIPDMKLEIFKQFLAYLYTGSLEELSFEAAFDLYEAGDQYAVLGLAKKCSKFLIENLTVDNACRLLVVADAHGDDTFKEAVVSFMLEYEVPRASDCWQDFCSIHPVLANLVLNRSYFQMVR